MVVVDVMVVKIVMVGVIVVVVDVWSSRWSFCYRIVVEHAADTR